MLVVSNFNITSVKYFLIEKTTSDLTMNNRTKNAIIHIIRCTMKTEYGFPPSFNTIYEIGTISSKIVPTVI